jgi:hypothetical protein
MDKVGPMNRSQLDSRWLSGFTNQKDRDEFRELLVAQTLIWEKFQKLLDEFDRTNTRLEFNFETPNLRERFYYAEGYRKAIEDIRVLTPR